MQYYILQLNTKKGVSMSHIFRNIPESYVGLICIAFSLIIILDIMGVIYATFLIVLGALALFWYGFVMIQGPKKIRSMLDNIHIGNHKKD